MIGIARGIDMRCWRQSYTCCRDFEIDPRLGTPCTLIADRLSGADAIDAAELASLSDRCAGDMRSRLAARARTQRAAAFVGTLV